jgi:hypothetical protein
MADTSGEGAQTLGSFFDFIKSLAEISVVLGALLFLIGWSYLYGYFSGFGLSTDDLGLSPYNILIHCIPVIAGTKFLITSMLAIVLFVVAGYFDVTRRLLREIAFVLPLTLLAVFLVSKYAVGLGREYSHRDSYLSTTTLPYVAFEATTDSGSDIACNLSESNYRLLLRSNGHIFVILPIDGKEGWLAPNLRVCSFPDSRIQALRIQVGLPGR